MQPVWNDSLIRNNGKMRTANTQKTRRDCRRQNARRTPATLAVAFPADTTGTPSPGGADSDNRLGERLREDERPRLPRDEVQPAGRVADHHAGRRRVPGRALGGVFKLQSHRGRTGCDGGGVCVAQQGMGEGEGGGRRGRGMIILMKRPDLSSSKEGGWAGVGEKGLGIAAAESGKRKRVGFFFMIGVEILILIFHIRDGCYI